MSCQKLLNHFYDNLNLQAMLELEDILNQSNIFFSSYGPWISFILMQLCPVNRKFWIAVMNDKFRWHTLSRKPNSKSIFSLHVCSCMDALFCYQYFFFNHVLNHLRQLCIEPFLYFQFRTLLFYLISFFNCRGIKKAPNDTFG